MGLSSIRTDNTMTVDPKTESRHHLTHAENMGMDIREDLPSTRDLTAATITTPDITTTTESKIGTGEDYPRIRTAQRAGNINMGIVITIVITTVVNHQGIHPSVRDTRGNKDTMNGHALSVQACIQKIGL